MSSLILNVTVNCKSIHKTVVFFSSMGFNVEIIGTRQPAEGSQWAVLAVL